MELMRFIIEIDLPRLKLGNELLVLAGCNQGRNLVDHLSRCAEQPLKTIIGTSRRSVILVKVAAITLPVPIEKTRARDLFFGISRRGFGTDANQAV
jgi:hypothetical protein